MSARRFLDTNVLAYLYDRGVESPRARISADLLSASDNVVSAQVLDEFFVTATRNLGVAAGVVEADLGRIAALCTVVPIDATLVRDAVRRSLDDPSSYWDALIVETALASGCRVLFSDEFQAGRSYGRLVVHNPYGEAPAARESLTPSKAPYLNVTSARRRAPLKGPSGR